MPSETPIRILATLAVMGAMRALDFPAAGFAVDAEYAPTLALMKRIRAGEAADLAILTEQGITDLIAEGVMRPGSRQDVALSYVGIAVKAGAEKPDIGSAAALKATLLAAKSIAYSRIGASGIFFAGLIERLGIAEAVNAKATIIPIGFTAELAAKGEVELAVQQVSELLVIPGIELVGKLPPDLQVAAMFSGGVMTHSAQPEPAASLLRYLTSAEARPVLAASGLEAP